jgi:SAM-dependent methyltransferase
MAQMSAPRDFNLIAAAYDDTRLPASDTLLDGVADALRQRQVTSLLEIGVGTGRIARPLVDRGFTLTGVDAARAMIQRARAKQLDRLVLGNAYRLPFQPHSFDGVLMVHVLHLMDDPEAGMREWSRVARRAIGAWVTRRERDAANDALRKEVVQVFAECGVTLPARRGPWEGERKFLERFPPTRTRELGESDSSQSLEEQFDRMRRGADRATLHVPRDQLEAAIAAARAKLGNPVATHHQTELWVEWDLQDGPPKAAPP